MLVKKQNLVPTLSNIFIPLGDGKKAIVDPEDYDLLKRFRWFCKKSGSKIYAVRKYRFRGKEYLKRMHRDVAQCPPDKETHHLNRNTLDNRKCNLVNLYPYEHSFAHKSGSL